MTELWVDISNYQGQPDFGAMAGHVDGVVIKATEGTGFTNPDLLQQATGAKAAGLKRKFYHFADFTDMAAEAQHYLAVVRGFILPGETSVLDAELPGLSGDVAGSVLAWHSVVDDALGGVSWFYSYGPWIRAHLLSRDPELAQHPLWIAAYQAQEPAIPPPWSVAAGWQFTDAATVPGIQGLVDEDDFFVTTPAAPTEDTDDDDLLF